MDEIAVLALIEHARKRGVEVSRNEAARFLQARALLESDPEGRYAEAARNVVDDYQRHLETGQKGGPAGGFARFMLPPLETDEAAQMESEAHAI